MTSWSARRWMLRMGALLLAFGLIAAACGGSDDSGGDDASGENPRGEESSDPDDGAEPQRGGSIIFAREAETSSPWTPSAMICDVACHQAIKGIYDTLTWPDADGEVHGMLLESIEPNADFTEWTLTPRDGIQFHDGTPWDVAALDTHFSTMRDSVLVGNVFNDITDQQVQGNTLVLTMRNPWTHFPLFLGGQPGYVASPTWLAAVADGSASEAEPVGTGPFEFEAYSPGDSFSMTRNENYWLMAPDGEPYPYLDEIEFLVQDENQTRDNAIISGDIDITHMDSGDSIERLRQEADNGTINLFEIDQRQETGYVLINSSDPNAAVSDVRIRQAMAYAFDHVVENQSRNAGIFEIANGPFSPGSIGYLDDTGFPEFDLEQATALVDEYESDTGQDATIAYKTTTDPFNLQTAELYRGFWEAAGMTVTLDQIEQGEFITQALIGNFEAFGWRNHGGFDPDTQEVWWTSENALPAGEIALNFGRIDDPVIDENLDIVRESQDPAERQAAAEEINRQFAEQVYNIWTSWIIWAIPYQDRVHGVQTPVVMPDGTPSTVTGIGFTGAINLQQLWVDDAGA
ncbi:MAG TPA: ABC transporter substrate-binding protein [Acidimicrobiales bacterium]